MGASYVWQYDLCTGEKLGKEISSVILSYSTEQTIYEMNAVDLVICSNSNFCLS